MAAVWRIDCRTRGRAGRPVRGYCIRRLSSRGVLAQIPLEPWREVHRQYVVAVIPRIQSPPSAGSFLFFVFESKSYLQSACDMNFIAFYFFKIIQNTCCTLHLPSPANLAPALGLRCQVLPLYHPTLEAVGQLICEQARTLVHSE